MGFAQFWKSGIFNDCVQNAIISILVQAEQNSFDILFAHVWCISS